MRTSLAGGAAAAPARGVRRRLAHAGEHARQRRPAVDRFGGGTAARARPADDASRPTTAPRQARRPGLADTAGRAVRRRRHRTRLRATRPRTASPCPAPATELESPGTDEPAIDARSATALRRARATDREPMPPPRTARPRPARTCGVRALRGARPGWCSGRRRATGRALRNARDRCARRTGRRIGPCRRGRRARTWS